MSHLRCLCGSYVQFVPHPNSKAIADKWNLQDVDGGRVAPCKRCIRREINASTDVLNSMGGILKTLLPVQLMQVIFKKFPDLTPTEAMRIMKEVIEDANRDGD